ncbi:hypothetical protein BC829DRAFT_247520 [Chytridium lagenaria]|nr:hypothetical protein BC829DRAFT_247520 [Chytridium lagenaria]
MDRSFYDECSILNLSLGGGSAWSDTPDALLADVLSQTGEIIVSSAGTNKNLEYSASTHQQWSFSTTAVGAVENSEYPARVLNLVNDTRGIPFTFAIGKELNITMLVSKLPTLSMRLWKRMGVKNFRPNFLRVVCFNPSRYLLL